MKLTSFLVSLAALTVSGAALAQEADDPRPPPLAPPPATAFAPVGAPPVIIPISPGATPPPSSLPPSVHVAPDGSIDVQRTPEQGVDVHAQTDAGTVHAYSCSRVQLDPRTATPGANVAVAPPPAGCPAPYPYPVPYYYYPPPVYYAPYYYPPPKKPKYADDPTRTGVIIASSLAFGLGTAAAGGAYVSSLSHSCSSGDFGETTSCSDRGSQAALWSMGGFMTFTPSIPRLAMGDVGVAVVLTALRGSSFIAGAVPRWGNDNTAMPIMFAFIVPVTLGVIDLALTPHREQMEKRTRDQAARDANRVRLKSLAPAIAKDDRGNTIKTLAAGGTF